MTLPAGAALVTGAAKRIGRAIALDLAQAGCAVAVHYHASENEALELVEEIRSSGADAVAVRADLGLEKESQQLVRQAAEGLGRPLDILVNNASTFEHDSVRTATRETWDLHLEANLRAPFVLTQAFAKEVEGNGNVINLIDQRVWNLTPEFISYTVSKAGLWALTQSLALALAPAIRVNAIGPGPTLASARQTQAQFEAQCAAMPLGHGATPDDICAAVRYILSAPAMTGQMIALDGGQHLAWTGYGSDGREE